MKKHSFLTLAASFGACAVLLGAFGAHALENQLSPDMLARYHTAAEYQFYHALALLLTGLCLKEQPAKSLQYAGFAFTLGIILFSGSLYFYTWSGQKLFIIFTPIGGLTLFMGWCFLIYSFATKKPSIS